jgi:cysteine desulfurase
MMVCMNFLGFFRHKRQKPTQIFLDYASITPVDKRVQKEMEKYSGTEFANPSALYSEALSAKKVLDESREKIADILNVQKNDIFFTGSGTEGNNIAILGIFEAHRDYVPHFITSVVEHPSVLEVFKEIEKRGGEVTYVPVSSEGIINTKEIASAIKTNTVLVSIMYANNEIGTIQPIKEISKNIREWRHQNKTNLPYFHTDACQAALYLPIDCLKLGVDLMTLDGIKIYGPRGVGMIYIKNNVKISPVIFGGGQEKNIRSGTENIPGIAGFAIALLIAENLKEKEIVRLKDVRDYGISEIRRNFPKAILNGSLDFRLPNNINFCFPGLDAEFAVISLDVNGISASYSSSCRNLKEDSSSYVVESLGKKDCQLSSLRFTLGRETTKNDIDELVIALKRVAHSAR